MVIALLVFVIHVKSSKVGEKSVKVNLPVALLMVGRVNDLRGVRSLLVLRCSKEDKD